MERCVFADKQMMGAAAAGAAAEVIKAAIVDKGQANVILATGASQFEVLKNLVAAEGIDWSKVVMFHLDEYIGMAESHPASFRRFLRERFVDPLPRPPAESAARAPAGSPALFRDFMRQVNQVGLLDARTKKLIAIALSVAQRCEPCLTVHLKGAAKTGLSKAEIDEAAWLGIAFAGSPAMMMYNQVCRELKL